MPTTSYRLQCPSIPRATTHCEHGSVNNLANHLPLRVVRSAASRCLQVPSTAVLTHEAQRAAASSSKRRTQCIELVLLRPRRVEQPPSEASNDNPPASRLALTVCVSPRQTHPGAVGASGFSLLVGPALILQHHGSPPASGRPQIPAARTRIQESLRTTLPTSYTICLDRLDYATNRPWLSRNAQHLGVP